MIELKKGDTVNVTKKFALYEVYKDKKAIVISTNGNIATIEFPGAEPFSNSHEVKHGMFKLVKPVKEQKKFMYLGLEFTPFLDKQKDLLRRCWGSFTNTQTPVGWDYDEFYKIAKVHGAAKFDIFLVDGEKRIPAGGILFFDGPPKDIRKVYPNKEAMMVNFIVPVRIIADKDVAESNVIEQARDAAIELLKDNHYGTYKSSYGIDKKYPFGYFKNDARNV